MRTIGFCDVVALVSSDVSMHKGITGVLPLRNLFSPEFRVRAKDSLAKTSLVLILHMADTGEYIKKRLVTREGVQNSLDVMISDRMLHSPAYRSRSSRPVAWQGFQKGDPHLHTGFVPPPSAIGPRALHALHTLLLRH